MVADHLMGIPSLYSLFPFIIIIIIGYPKHDSFLSMPSSYLSTTPNRRLRWVSLSVSHIKNRDPGSHIASTYHVVPLLSRSIFSNGSMSMFYDNNVETYGLSLRGVLLRRGP